MPDRPVNTKEAGQTSRRTGPKEGSSCPATDNDPLTTQVYYGQVFQVCKMSQRANILFKSSQFLYTGSYWGIWEHCTEHTRRPVGWMLPVCKRWCTGCPQDLLPHRPGVTQAGQCAHPLLVLRATPSSSHLLPEWEACCALKRLTKALCTSTLQISSLPVILVRKTTAERSDSSNMGLRIWKQWLEWLDFQDL